MTSTSEELPDLEALLSQAAPPSTPRDSFALAQGQLDVIRTWKRPQAIAAAAGMLTNLGYHAHVVRIDWLVRLIVAHASGKKKPRQKDFTAVLNRALVTARVASMEDPIEGFFVESVPTDRGDFLIFEGHWEGAAQYTETVLRAFERLPDAIPKVRALNAVYSLLRLSTAVVQRSGLERRAYDPGKPQSDISVASDSQIRTLSQRVVFTDKDLLEIGIAPSDLHSFVLAPDHYQHVDCEPVGSSLLDNFPLIRIENGILVSNPGSLSLAVRASLLDAANRGGMGLTLAARLAETQEAFALSTGFWAGRELRLSSFSRHLLRTTVVGLSPGRYLHVTQVMPDPTAFNEQGFGGVAALREGTDAAIGEEVARFWTFLSKLTDYREAITVVLMSGWGGWVIVDPQIDDVAAPKRWRYMALSFADAATLGACEDGRLQDLWRIHEQLSILENVGYQVQRLNGVLNLFGNWQSTGSTFVPEHWDADPPALIWLPHDDVFKPRKEGEENRDVRSVPLPDGSFDNVQRAEWGQGGPLKPIYISLAGIDDKRLMGVVVQKERSWWIELVNDDKESLGREWRFQLWNAVMQWLGIAAPHLIASFPDNFIAAPCHIRIVTAGESLGQVQKATTPTGSARDHLDLHFTDNKYEVHINAGWPLFLGRLGNEAEFALASAVVEQIAAANGKPLPRADAERCLREAIPSTDWKYLHAHQVRSPFDELLTHGIYPQFNRIPRSASALVRCGSVWRFWDRSKGHEFKGQEECRGFLAAYYDFVLTELIQQIRRFDRARLVTASAIRYGAARQENDRWKRTIRAMRSIHGSSIDNTALKQISAFNAVQRAAKSICEIGACEAPVLGGAIPAREDIDEMFARALLLFGNGQLYATIRAGLVEPHLKISAAGDLLSDRSIFERTFMPSTRRANAKTLDAASDDYAARLADSGDTASPEILPWSNFLREAVAAEYSCSPEAFVDFPSALTRICASEGKGVLVMCRSALAEIVAASGFFPHGNCSALLERLTLSRREDWKECPTSHTPRDLELWRYDRKHSIINRPLLAITSDDDPLLVISPIFVLDAIMYQLGALHHATVHSDNFWESKEARAYAGARAQSIGEEFENEVAGKLSSAGYVATPRKKVTALLEQSVDGDLGDVDVFAVSPCGGHVWVIEAKNLKFCRTEAEVAARMSDYAGKMRVDEKGRKKPDKLLRHLNRVRVLRENAVRLGKRLDLGATPEVHGLVVVDAPQPMNFFMLEENADGHSCMLDDLIETLR